MSELKIIEKNQLIKLYQSGKSQRQIAEILKCSLSNISRLFKKFSLKTRKRNVKYKSNESFFGSETQAAFYFAGLIAADGNLKREKSKSTQLQMALTDLVLILLLKKYCQTEHPIAIVSRENRKEQYAFRIRSNQIDRDLDKFLITPQKTFTAKFPIHLKNHKYIRDFIRGYFDGDGHFHLRKKKRSISFGLCGTKDFLIEVRDIINAECNLDILHERIALNNNCYVLHYEGNVQVRKIVTWLYRDCGELYLPRKYDKPKSYYGLDDLMEVQIPNLYKIDNKIFFKGEMFKK